MQKKTSSKHGNMPLVSIVVPIYNSEKYLSECLDSALSQTYPNIEIICINDGSTDKSPLIAKRYAKKNGSISVFSQKNSGPAVARNKAIMKAKGKYILPLDDDDIIKKDCVEKLYNIIVKTNCAVASPGVEFFGQKSGVYKLPRPTSKNMALQNCIINASLFEKKYWEKYGGYDENFKGIEDYDFWWNFIQDNKKIVRTSEILFFYRIKNNQFESYNYRTRLNHSDLLKLMPEKYPLMKKYQRMYFLPIKIKSQTRSILVKILCKINVFKWVQYKNYVLNQQLNKKDFIPITNNPYSNKAPKKIIAYYLPQYYQIPQNDAWFGRGFTEWSNCAKAVPQFAGHWQPHTPIDVGFYNLETTLTMNRQIELAKTYGIYGFCFYYYWFSGGDKIMEKPINNWLNDKTLNFPFMLFWANEDWTNTWGEKADVGTKTYSAKMKPDDVEKFVNDIIPFFKDKRYIKINNRPHLIIYQSKKDPYLSIFIKELSDSVEKKGLKRPFISLVFPDDSPQNFNPFDFGADAAVEFGVHMKIRPDHIQNPVKNRLIVNPLAKLVSYDMQKFIYNKKFIYKTDFPVYKGAMTTFDNTARKIYTGAHIFSLSPTLYKEWLSELIKTSNTDYIFLSAWNEWAEGMHLEPDQKFGYAYLQATKEALEENS